MAALAQAATVLGSIEHQVIAQYVQQWRIRIRVDLLRLAVDSERDHARTLSARRTPRSL